MTENIKIFPLEKITRVPTGMDGHADIAYSNDLIDIMDKFKFQTLRSTNKPYYRGISGYLFDAQIHVGFGKNYKISDVEFRYPFSCLGGAGIFYRDVSLIRPTLLEVQNILKESGISTKEIDVGINAPEIGVSFSSSDYEGELCVRLDAITVHLTGTN
jgi:hypothetical protein